MILLRLKEYWERQTDRVAPGYQPAFLTKKLVFRDGRFVRPVALSGLTRGKGKDARHGLMVAVPREQPQRTSGVKARLLHDNPEYALGFIGEGRDPKKVAERHLAYRKLLAEAQEATGNPELRTVLNWLEAGGAEALRDSGDIGPMDDLLFEVDGKNPTDDPALQAFWGADKDLPQGFCLVTGETTGIGGPMPYPAKGVPGGQTSGTMLVSVNMKAAESYGLEGNLSSPIGSVAAEAICNGLNHLLASAENSLKINDTVYLYWHRVRDERDALLALKKPSPEEVEEHKARHRRLMSEVALGQRLSSPRTGHPGRKAERADFHILALTANASRIVVRDYHETTLETVDANLGEWFIRLDLVGTNGKAIPPPTAFRLAASLYRDSKDIPKHVPVELLECALQGHPLSNRLLALATRRNTAMQGPFDEFNRQRRLSYPRLALIKACLSFQAQDDLFMLNETLDIPAYQCGRLLSILESIQRIAIPGLNATLTDRHYGAACATPGIIFGSLIKDATSAHLPKLRKNQRGAFVALDRRLQQVLSQLDELPRTLDYEGQGYFALGYYHQRAHDVAEALAKRAAGRPEEAPTLVETIDTADQETAS